MLDWLREVSESNEAIEDVDDGTTIILGDTDEPQPVGVDGETTTKEGCQWIR
jgi:hypothetical protein